MDIIAEFEKYEDEFLKFERVAIKRSRRPDLHAFIVLDEISPSADGKSQDVLSAAEHDEIWLSFDLDDVAAEITSDQVKDLIRCGVRIDDHGEGFCMFV